MRKKDATVRVMLQLPSDYFEKLDEIFEDEFVIAQKKWGITLDEHQKQKIYQNSFFQWREKVATVSKNPVDRTYNRVTFNIRTQDEFLEDYVLPKKHKVNIPLMDVQAGWTVGREEGKPFVYVNDFYDFMVEKFEKWMRTAVFYGVGSYVG